MKCVNIPETSDSVVSLFTTELNADVQAGAKSDICTLFYLSERDIWSLICFDAFVFSHRLMSRYSS